MKVAVFGPRRRVGVLHDDAIIDINAAYAKLLTDTSSATRPLAQADATVPANLTAFIAEGTAALAAARAAIDHVAPAVTDTRGINGELVTVPLGEAILHPPIDPAARIFAALANFADHMNSAAENANAEELQAKVEALLAGGPKFFWKDPRTASTHGEPVLYPRRTQRLDYEAEIAIVISMRGRNIMRDDAAGYIWGYTLFNDWSIRDNVSFGPDFAYAKNFDTSATFGPWIVVDEITDPQNIPIECHVNGELRQHGNTKSMVHDFATLIQHVSSDLTLLPGDVIASGTPQGTAIDSSPPGPDGTVPDTRFVKPGDVVEVASELIGVLRNRIIGQSSQRAEPQA